VRSLRRTLVVSILGGVGVVLGVAGAAVYAIARGGLRERFDEALVARARTIAAMVVEEPRNGGEAGGLVFEYYGSLRLEDLGVLVRASTGDGKVLAESPGWQEGWSLSPQLGSEPVLKGLNLERAAARGAAVAAVATRDPEDVHAGAAEPVPERTAIVQVVGMLDEVEDTESALAWALVIGGLAGLAGAAVAVCVGVRRGLAPLARLREELAEVDAREPRAVSNAGAYPEELRPVVSTLGELLQRLRAVVERERRFTDAAAHELRTPIAELRTIVDVARKWPDEERMRRGLAEAGAVAEEMGALLEVLLAAARGGAAYAGQEAETVALLPVAREMAGRAVPSGGSRGVSWMFEGDETASWQGPRAAIAAIVRNLVQNAGEYTPAGGSVRVTVGREDGVVLRIENGPVTLSAADVERMFEPFWRGDASRTDRGHRGLGLAIVTGLCESLGMQAAARLRDGVLEIVVAPR
jgi:signal transduction histidine kinase